MSSYCKFIKVIWSLNQIADQCKAKSGNTKTFEGNPAHTWPKMADALHSDIMSGVKFYLAILFITLSSIN